MQRHRAPVRGRWGAAAAKRPWPGLPAASGSYLHKPGGLGVLDLQAASSSPWAVPLLLLQRAEAELGLKPLGEADVTFVGRNTASMLDG